VWVGSPSGVVKLYNVASKLPMGYWNSKLCVMWLQLHLVDVSTLSLPVRCCNEYVSVIGLCFLKEYPGVMLSDL